ncbi:bifunctional DNA primase/polymerase-like protein [Kribbella sp. VKM Ac-2527]|uniref:Bifunctional DNA primase/polymerase-like protein n=1 Tax=Kribbella caucasensis TaxID=2512215 RepID=A0A4R6KQB0_9ACTN|nr:bifunctional DNA primase/polymerase [Kribbella sp. VKM Ac-2527]TDO54559.1 bifunctional DNA primase/polymerase-like protein [Kribbella sp. VKM Ac-2527]
MFDRLTHRRHAQRVFERATRYAANGWPVAPLAVPRHGVCPCDLGDCVDPHLVGEPIRNGFLAAGAWRACPWDIALVTADFDVVDLPPEYGALLNQLLKATCPTAMAPARRRWWFFLAPGSISPDQVSQAGGVLHSGADGWVPAPGTVLDGSGRIRWLVHPHLTAWQPYERRDPIDLVLGAPNFRG